MMMHQLRHRELHAVEATGEAGATDVVEAVGQLLQRRDTTTTIKTMTTSRGHLARLLVVLLLRSSPTSRKTQRRHRIATVSSQRSSERSRKSLPTRVDVSSRAPRVSRTAAASSAGPTLPLPLLDPRDRHQRSANDLSRPSRTCVRSACVELTSSSNTELRPIDLRQLLKTMLAVNAVSSPSPGLSTRKDRIKVEPSAAVQLSRPRLDANCACPVRRGA